MQTNTKINVLCLCCGIVPEIIALKKLEIEIGIVYVLDIDLDAVGVAIAQFPDVDFRTVSFGTCGNTPYKGQYCDVSELKQRTDILKEIDRDCGFVTIIITTSPCTSFSKAGPKQGFSVETGHLYDYCTQIVKWYTRRGTAFFLGENVDSTKQWNAKMTNHYDGIEAIMMNGKHVSAMTRPRMIRTNYPPADDLTDELDHTKPSRLLRNCVDTSTPHTWPVDGAIHPARQKTACLLRSKQGKSCVWTQKTPYSDPKPREFRIHELEKLMGHAVDFTKYTVGQAIRDRIKNHNVGQDGHIVRLKGAGTAQGEKKEELSPTQRQQLLGNSVLPDMFTAALKPMVDLFPPVDAIPI